MSADAGFWARVSPLLDRVLEVPPPERAAWLDRECAGDPVLRRELDGLLAAGEGGVLSRPVDDLAALLLADDAPAVAEGGRARAGDRVGPYRVLSELGQGGMGAVYLAERADGQFEQRVALKLVKRGMDSDEVLRRFLAERRILARLEHEGVARLYDGGIARDGTPWFAMEHVTGVPITVRAERERLPLAARLDLLVDVCAAVQYAHRNLVVHRDLKPSNVLVTEDGKVKLLDFGIAKLLDEGADGATRTGMRMLTPGYAAPEQLAGGDVTTSTDVWALGVLAHEVLTGGRPERPGAAPRPLASTEPPTISRGLPRELRQILARALAPEPERRYASAEALAEDLARFRRGEPVRAHGDSLGYRLGKFVRRHRVAVAAGTAVAAALIVGLGVALRQTATARREAARATAARDFLVGLFKAADPAESRGQVPDAYQLLERGQARIETELADRPELAADLLEAIAEIEGELSRFGRGAALLVRAIELRRGMRPYDELRVATDLARLADLRLEEGDLESSERAVQEALAIDRRRRGDDHLETLTALSLLGSLRSRQGRYDEAEAILRQTSVRSRSLLGEDHLRTYTELNSLAVLLQNRGRFAEAEKLHRELVAWSERNRPPDHHERATDYHNLGTVLDRLDRDREAEDLLRRALAMRERMLPLDHAYTLGTMRNLAALLAQQDRFDEAAALATTALQRERAARGDTRLVASLERVRGRIDLERGDLAGAGTHLGRSAALWQELAGPDFPARLRAAAEVAEVRIARGEAEAGLAELRASLARQQATAAPRGDVAASRTLEARALTRLHRGDEALAAAEAAVAEARAAWGDRHSELAAALAERAGARFARGLVGDADAGRADLDSADTILVAVVPAGRGVARRVRALRGALRAPAAPGGVLRSITMTP